MDIWDGFLKLFSLYWIHIIFGLFFLVGLLVVASFLDKRRTSGTSPKTAEGRPKLVRITQGESNCWRLCRLCLEIRSAAVNCTSTLDINDDSNVGYSRNCIFYVLGINAEGE